MKRYTPSSEKRGRGFLRTAGLLAAAAVLLAAVLLAAAYAITPGCPLPVFGQGDLRIFWDGSGGLSLTWPAADSDAEYLVSVCSSSQHFEERLQETHAAFSGFSDGERLRVSVRAVSEGVNLLGMARQVKSWSALKASLAPVSLEALSVEGEAEPGSIRLSWNGRQGKRYEVCTLEDGVYLPVASTNGTSLALRFGSASAELDFPEYGKSVQVVVREGIPGRGYTLYGPPSNPLTFERGDLLGNALSLAWTQTGLRTYELQWSETQGDYYELQQWRGGRWETITQIAASAQSLRYDTRRVGSGSLQRYRVRAMSRAGMVLASEEVSFYADISPLYATVWPIQELDGYDSPNASSPPDNIKIPAGTALCVLEESGEWFRVRYQNQYLYIDSRFCMINLTEYLGDYCAYNITNCHSSVLTVHDRPLSKITGQAIPGFENAQTENGFLVPCLYPSAQKLLAAAKAAMEDGFRLKIYEAFRPHQASRFLYDTVFEQMELPALTVDGEGNAIDPSTGNPVDLATGLPVDSATEPSAPEAEEEPGENETATVPETPEASEPPGTVTVPIIPEEPVIPENPEAPQTAPAPEETTEIPEDSRPQAPLALAPQTISVQTLTHYAKRLEPDRQNESTSGNVDPSAGDEQPPSPAYDTYSKIMTGSGRFRLANFLAPAVSAHNRGIAFDLTLEELDTGWELEMQTQIHDLSWYSATYRNNANAKRLARYMAAAGLEGSSTEWWHFQDSRTRETLNLDAYLENGVSAAGLVRDDTGWRCRNADGTYTADTAVIIDGITYMTGGDGYIIT